MQELHLPKELLNKAIKDYEEEIGTTSLTADQIDHFAYMATQYEKDGLIDFEGFLEEMLHENCTEQQLVSIYLDSCYGFDIHDFSDPEWFFNEMFNTPYEAVRAVMLGKVRYIDDYIKFNGYGNLETLNATDIVELIDRYVASEILDTSCNFNLPEIIEDIIDSQELIRRVAMMLVRRGF